MNRETLDRLLDDATNQREGVLVTDLASGEQQLLYVDAMAPDTPSSIAAAARDAILDDKCSTIEDGGRQLFIRPFVQQFRMIIVGAVHIAQALAVMAAAAGWDVVIIDPRQAWSTPDRFPGVRMSTDWPDAALAALKPDARTAIITLTHDPKLDDPALSVALGSPAFYVGSLGSRKTHEARLKRLSEAGFREDELGRIHAPVGLPIGARTPAEVAIAILAEVTQVLRGNG